MLTAWTAKATKNLFKHLSPGVSAALWNMSGWFPPMSLMLSSPPKSWTPPPLGPLPSFRSLTHEHEAVAVDSPVCSL